VPIKGIMTKLEDGRDAIELVEDEDDKKEVKKGVKVYSDGRGGVYQLEFDFDDQVAPI
jgi:hypothetical protein